ncbi:MAG: 3-deoxy-D-manno-octulosonic acid transferase [Luteolibacter sp.]
MRWLLARILYRILLPVVFLTAFPGWLLKMLRRGGMQSPLGERLAFYTRPPEFDPCGAVHIHAISVGETLLALRLIRAWRKRQPELSFVLATGTATGHAVARAEASAQLRVTYAPLDFPSMVRRYLKRFEPRQIILVEGEAWPNLLRECSRCMIPVSLVNARMSPRSAKRYQRFAAWLRPMFGLLESVAIQDPCDAQIWNALGVPPERIHHTGSLKFDPSGSRKPAQREEFQQILDRFGNHGPVVLAASTHVGEEVWIAQAIRDAAPDALVVLVPRHAERRDEVAAALRSAGFGVVLRSHPSAPPANAVLVVDSTGELRDWTAHADVVVIGKSFLARGGQNPAEAIMASKALVFGPRMENFEPLASRLVDQGGALRTDASRESLAAAIHQAIQPQRASMLRENAAAVLAIHNGACERILDMLECS